jgi:hypothetical protein
VIGLGQAETADQLAAGKAGEESALLGFAAEDENRQHDQRGLNAHHRAVARVYPFDLARNESVADIVEAGATVLGRDGRTEQADLAHFPEDRRVARSCRKAIWTRGASLPWQ